MHGRSGPSSPWRRATALVETPWPRNDVVTPTKITSTATAIAVLSATAILAGALGALPGAAHAEAAVPTLPGTLLVVRDGALLAM